MKIRTDFVSNSSSSSFIVLHKDNKHDLLFGGSEVEHYNLTEFLKLFGRKEFLGDSLWNKNLKMKFVTDEGFLKHFIKSQGDGLYLPKNCKSEYLKLLSYKKQMDQIYESQQEYHEEIISVFYDAQELLEDQILDKVKIVLDKEYKNEIFDYICVSDNQSYENDIDGDFSDEEKIMNRIKFAKKQIPSFKFFKYNDMH